MKQSVALIGMVRGPSIHRTVASVLIMMSYSRRSFGKTRRWLISSFRMKPRVLTVPERPSCLRGGVELEVPLGFAGAAKRSRMRPMIVRSAIGGSFVLPLRRAADHPGGGNAEGADDLGRAVAVSL